MTHKHHRKRRSQGGDDSPDNIMEVTSAEHHYIHTHVQESYDNGWLVHSYDDPAEVLIVGWPLSAAAHRTDHDALPLGVSDTAGSLQSGSAELPCPKCKGTGRAPKEQKKLESARKRVTLGIRLPKDADENGIEVLESLLSIARDELKDQMGWSDSVAVYYVLVAVLHDWITGRTA